MGWRHVQHVGHRLGCCCVCVWGGGGGAWDVVRLTVLQSKVATASFVHKTP